MVLAYITYKPSNKYVGYSPVYDQHIIWIRFSKGYICTRRSFREDLKKEVKKWVSEGEKFIIYIDANEAIRSRPLINLLKN